MSLITCFAVVFLAELGDKTQILSMLMVARYGAGKVLLGTAIGAATVSLVSVCLGLSTMAVVPVGAFQICSGVLFIAVGVGWLFAGNCACAKCTGGADTLPARTHLLADGSVLGIATGFFLAELGDKTMLAGVTLTSKFAPQVVWLGATLALVASEALAALGWGALGRIAGVASLRTMGAALFIAFGIFTLLTVFVHYPLPWPH